MKPPAKPHHAVSRALERYGVKLSKADLRTMAGQCAQGTQRLSKMRDGNERHLVHIHGVAMVVVYSPNREHTYDPSDHHKGVGSIVTVLPKEAALSGNPRSPATKFKRNIKRGGKSPKSRRKTRGY